ncbi:hypothetical protein CXF74_05515 [Psychromonas sp. Urea-02u-13]|nr:hypothetical protein CXF74_05515 [Psychromonas sp. Urea-02u-13]
MIELVIVIVILGILSTVALPKFVNLSRDARIATLEVIKGAMASTSLLVEMKAKIEGVENGGIKLNGQTVLVNNAYITGHWNNAWRHALDIGKDIGFTRTNATCTLNDICGVGNQRNHSGLPSSIVPSPAIARGLVMFWLEGTKLDDLCYAFYYNPSDGNSPTVGVVDEGC